MIDPRIFYTIYALVGILWLMQVVWVDHQTWFRRSYSTLLVIGGLTLAVQTLQWIWL